MKKISNNNFKISTLLFLSAFFFLLFPTHAQINPPLRIELEGAKDQQEYKYFSLDNQGVAVFFKSAAPTADTAQWVFIQYDTNLFKINQYKIKLPNKCQFLDVDYSNQKLYLFLQKPAQKKDTLKNFLLEWNITTSKFQLIDLQNYRNSFFSSMKIKDDYLFILVDEQKNRSITFYNYKTHTHQTIHVVDEEVTSIESFCIDTVSKTTYFCMFLKNKQSSRAELFRTDYSGKLKERVVLPYEENFVYHSVKIAPVGRDSLLLIGGYSNNKEKKNKGGFSGIYTIQFSKNGFFNKNVYKFGAMAANDSAFNITPFVETNLLMNVHITQFNGKIFVVTEFFYPEYQFNVSSFRNYGYFGYEPPVQSFTGFQYLNAYISEFNAQGKMLQEWYFPIQNVLTKSMNNLVGLYQDKEGNSLFYYVNMNNVVSQFMNGKHLLSPQTAVPIELINKSDVIEYSTNVIMQHWYGNNFLLSGYQYIKNPQRGKGKRYVFFLNKMLCE